MVTLRTSSVDMEDHAGGRPRKMSRGPPEGGMGMPPMGAMNAGPRGRVGPPMGGPGLPPPSAVPGGGGPRTTATSRRGGRTRARSPIVASGGAGRRPGSTEPPNMRSPTGERRGPKGENPSSAAAAAAAAAKAFSDNGNGGPPGSRNSQWPDRHHADERSGYPTMAPMGYNSRGGGGSGSSKKWPPGEDPKMAGGPGPGHYSGQRGYGPYGGGYEGYPGEPYDRRYRGESRGHPASHHHPYKGPGGMEGGHRGGPPPESGGRGPMYHHHHRGHSDYHQRPYMGSRGEARGPPPPVQSPPPSAAGASSGNNKGTRSAANSNNNSSAAGGGTSLVIGGTTPIHVPKPEAHPEPAELPTRASAAPIFRGRGDSATSPSATAASAPAGSDGPSDEESPSKILLSLKTPTSSFEEKKNEDTKRPATSELPLSPKDPPQLHSTTQQHAVDMFERSPEGNKNAPTIDIAPSFTLFSRSFDSFGDHLVDATLNADSFGIMQTTSTGGDGEGMTNVLRSALSGGNGSTQLLAPSASGQLTIGYSPVNSFGNVSAAAAPPRRDGSGNMLLLGGPEARSSSPTQVLSSYHQGYNGTRDGALEDSHLRMSVGSFGGHSYGRPNGYGDHAGSQYYYGGMGGSQQPEKSPDGSPPFYSFLKKYKKVFVGLSFLLPGLKVALLEKSKSDDKKNESRSNSPPEQKSSMFQPGDPSARDLTVARRRVESSVCAFGGSVSKDNPAADETGSTPNSSIFREREKSSQEEPTATVTPSSSTASPPRSSPTNKKKDKYEEELPGRYYENESRLSWEFEENPPVHVSPYQGGVKAGATITGGKKEVSKSSDDASTSSKRIGASSPPASKMRYRCKLCGQPKQNHTCPFQQSLARSIGIMVYPAVNAFTAAEPGSIAPALAEMNNFTDISEKGSVANESSPGRSGVPLTSPKQVTPESARASPRQLQMGSPPNTPGKTPTRSNAGTVRRGNSRGRKRSHQGYEKSDDPGDLLFVEAMELKPQQFVNVSETHELNVKKAFAYLPLPLPYAQRKRLSDNLFSLSNEVPKLTDECAQVLREAREQDKWDLAVSELMTQVICILHCREGDHRFEGLRHYLLTLGFAC